MVRDRKLEPVLNSAPARGLSYSLQLGLTALEETDAAAALILLGDQPLVRLDVVDALISAWYSGGEAIVRSRYAANAYVPGHPVLVARSVWPLIREVNGDAGFASFGSRVGETLVDVPGHNPDIDTLSDLQALEVLQQ
jgi:molybdenum cofactor cytidylyltransferase